MARPKASALLLLQATLLAAAVAPAAAAGAAVALEAPSPVLELNRAAVVHGQVQLAGPSPGCASVSIEMEGQPALEVEACPDAAGAAAFAMPLFFSADGSSRLGRVVITQPTTGGSLARLWQQLISARGVVTLRADMTHTAAVGPADLPAAPATAAAPASAAALAPCACRQRTCLHLEDAGDRSVPAYLAAAAPTCRPPPLVDGETEAAAPAPTNYQRLALGLGAACVLQAAVLVAVALRRSSRARAAEGGADRQQAGCSEAAAAPTKGSLRDACTSPLVQLLSSPFLGRHAAAKTAGLDSIPEEPGMGDSAEEAGGQLGGDSDRATYGGSPPASANGGGGRRLSFGGLVAAPAGWTRDAWGRLQRASGRGLGGKAASAALALDGVQHPPPFGSAPGTAYRVALQ